jgi:hypothetical protein
MVFAEKKLDPLMVGFCTAAVNGETGEVGSAVLSPYPRRKVPLVELEPGIGICTEASSQKPKTRGHVEGNGSPYCKLPRSWSDRIAGCAGRKNESGDCTTLSQHHKQPGESELGVVSFTECA